MLLDLRSLWEGPFVAKVKVTPGRLLRRVRKIYRDPAATDGVLVADSTLQAAVQQHRVFRIGELVADAGLSSDVRIRRAVFGQWESRGGMVAEVRVRINLSAEFEAAPMLLTEERRRRVDGQPLGGVMSLSSRVRVKHAGVDRTKNTRTLMILDDL